MEQLRFTVAILGTGLMGGSLGYAIRGFRGCLRIGYDLNPSALAQALEQGAVDVSAGSCAEAVKNADLSIFCAKPSAVISEIKKAAAFFKEGSVVTEICGVKSGISERIPGLLPAGVHYAGLHPMAGKEVGGFINADEKLYQNAGFIIVPPKDSKPEAVDLLRELSEYAGARRVEVDTPQTHDRIIGYTSDLMHIAAAALCESYPRDMTSAHTAGAYRDCTRIAEIDPALWTELLLENAAHALPHLEAYIHALESYRDAMAERDRDRLYKLLDRSLQNKKEMKLL